MLNTIRRRFFRAQFVVTFALLLAPVSAFPTSTFHLALKRSEPAKDSSLDHAPTAITLWFTQKPEMAVTTISLLDARAVKIEMADPRVDATDATVVIADVKGRVGPGTYTARWKTSSHDGHVVRGEFGFTVRAPASK